jgi:hypothetical protein
VNLPCAVQRREGGREGGGGIGKIFEEVLDSFGRGAKKSDSLP